MTLSPSPVAGGATPATGALLSIRDLRRSYGGLQAVDGVSFDVRPGGIRGLIGPNGAGKSTVLGIVAGAIAPTGGTVTFDGRDVTSLAVHERARLGLTRTFQLSSEFPRLTVLENLLAATRHERGDSLWGALLGERYWGAVERELVERARELLARFGMEARESDYAGNLSGGQKRLVEIMRALMTRPRLLLLDEPMAGVHPNLAQSIATYLERLRDEGLTMLMVEHELSIVDRLCDPVVVMAQGRIIAEGTMAEVRRNEQVLEAYLVG
ncbi:MAG: ABC transporter ATP-binding protein [Chloroflexi bacterium]|nr:ABC transporter ATP-binding protein [Chloroflexota bacterium]